MQQFVSYFVGAAIDSPITELHYRTKNFWTSSFLVKSRRRPSRRGSPKNRTRPSRKGRSRVDKKKKSKKGKKDSEGGYASKC